MYKDKIWILVQAKAFYVKAVEPLLVLDVPEKYLIKLIFAQILKSYYFDIKFLDNNLYCYLVLCDISVYDP